MIKKNDRIQLRILRPAGGRGVAKTEEGMTVFVENALPGETVDALILKTTSSCAFAKALSISVPSPHRREPDCPHAAQCGGCSCRHMDYALTLEAKRQEVKDAFLRIGGIDIEVPPVLGMEKPEHYRNKISLPVAGEKGTPRIGYFAPRSHRVIPVTACPAAMEEAMLTAETVQAWMVKFSVEPYDETRFSGCVRHVMCRVSRRGESMAVIVAAAEKLPHEAELIALLRASVPGLVSVQMNINKRRDNVILGDRCRVLWGSERLRDTLCGLSFELSPLSFFQINPLQTEKLYRTALEFAALSPLDEAVDLYCGAGTISLSMARLARHVTGIEIVPQAIEDAGMNARANGIANADFYAAPAETLLPELVAKGLRPDVVMMDPPRKGAEESVLRAIAQCAPRRVVYVSCDVHTQARDVKLLLEAGYRLEKVQPVDMFPWTEHVETVVLMSRADAAGRYPDGERCQ